MSDDFANTPVPLLQLITVDSTNTYALEHAQELDDLTLITAEEQTAGKGRLGRVWVSQKGSNCCATWLLKNWTLPAHQSTWLLSLAVLATIYEIAPELEPWIKWPNDIMIGDKKLAGMLAECRNIDGKNVIALGVGLNINMTAKELALIPQAATSLFVELKEKINCKFFEEALAFSLKQVYIIYQQESIDTIFEDWHELNGLLDRKVAFTDPLNRTIEGTVIDFTPEGEIVIDTPEGEQAYQCGDIQLIKSKYTHITQQIKGE